MDGAQCEEVLTQGKCSTDTHTPFISPRREGKPWITWAHNAQSPFRGCGWHLAGGGQKVINSLRCAGQPTPRRMIWPRARK